MNGLDLKSEATVSLHALQGGKFTLPERFFVSPLEDLEARRYVPSLCFLIQHHPSSQSRSDDTIQQNGNGITISQSQPTRLLFDLGLRRDLSLYSSSIQEHIKTRLPIDTSIDVVSSLAVGGLSSDDIDMIILSHVHWDHIGLPAEFKRAKFVVGRGALSLLGGKALRFGSHSCFEQGILPPIEEGRTIELQATPSRVDTSNGNTAGSSIINLEEKTSGKLDSTDDFEAQVRNGISAHETPNIQPWKPFSLFSNTIDLFNDGSVYIISAPGHLPGHLNLLCKVSTNPIKFIYLAGDSCHDRRLLTGEKEVAEWEEEGSPEVVCCIHADREEAKNTLGRIWEAECGRGEGLGGSVEVVFAHDATWEERAKMEFRFFPGHM